MRVSVCNRDKSARRISIKSWAVGCGLALTPFVHGTAIAQSAQPANPTREDLEPFDPAPAPPPRVAIEGDIERAPCALADPAYADIKLTLSSVNFNNLGPVPAAELTPLYQRYIGTEQPVSLICDIRDAAATYLRGKGYIAAVQVPTQRIENGAVSFEVLYARMTSIRVLGDAGRSDDLFEAYLSPMANGEPFNRFAAERHILLARDVPGYDVRLALRPAGTGAGEMVGEVTLRHTPVIADFNAQNYAARDTGRIGAQLRAQFRGLIGNGDRTTISAYTTADFEEQQIYQIGHDFLLGNGGLRLGGRFTFADSRPDLGAAIPDVRAKTYFYNAEASYPLRRRLNSSLRLGAGLDIVDQNVRFAGLPLSKDKLRVGYIRLDGDAVDLKGVGPKGTIGWRISGSVEARKGFDIFNASPDCFPVNPACSVAGFVPPALPDGDPEAAVFRFSGVAEGRILPNVVVSVAPRVQLTSKRLYAFEQFSIGNYTVGRGYDPGATVGDEGAGFSTEIRAEGLRFSTNSSISFQPYAFADNAWVWDKGRGAANPARISSLGGGLRTQFGNRARLDMTFAAPTRRLPGEASKRDPRFLVSLTTNILPWSNR